jgi:hypothetical protein
MARSTADQTAAIELLMIEVEELKKQIHMGAHLAQIAGSIQEVNETIKTLTPTPRTPMDADVQAQILRIRKSHLRAGPKTKQP